MDTLDAERERQRLAALYAGLSDLELQKLADDGGSLTDVAVEVLAGEARARGLNITIAATAVPMSEVQQRELVIVQQFRDIPAALLAKGALDSASIESFLVDDNLVRLDWFISNLLGGVKIAVREEDAEAAVQILEQPIDESFEVDGLGTYEQPRCPTCQSLDVTHEGGIDKRFALPALYLGVPLPLHRDVWKCASCGHQWRDESAGDRVDADETDDSSSG